MASSAAGEDAEHRRPGPARRPPRGRRRGPPTARPGRRGFEERDVGRVGQPEDQQDEQQRREDREQRLERKRHGRRGLRPPSRRRRRSRPARRGPGSTSSTVNASQADARASSASGGPTTRPSPSSYQGRKSATSSRSPKPPVIHSPMRSRRRSIAAGMYRRAARACLRRRGPGGLQGVHEQHRARHRPHAAGNRRDRAGALARGVEVHVAHQAVVGAVRAHVDHDGALAAPCRRSRGPGSRPRPPARRPRGRPRRGRACASGSA